MKRKWDEASAAQPGSSSEGPDSKRARKAAAAAEFQRLTKGPETEAAAPGTPDRPSDRSTGETKVVYISPDVNFGAADKAAVENAIALGAVVINLSFKRMQN